ncbi:acyl-CoA thioesterase [Pendulispora albinea]|uniref:Acyl-CoA thioesterase n=1 Tax=Pendulispora albinea TaxID=2741071 RepID=A0ABZ2M6A2_9BACT
MEEIMARESSSESNLVVAAPAARPSMIRELDQREKVGAGRLTEVRLIEMVFPEHTNHYGTLFGGQALALMDKAAFIVASRYVRRAVVTASSDKVDFHVPVRQGQLVELIARIVATGKTSIQVEVELWAEDLLTGDRQLGTRGRFVLVALDAHGRSTMVPALPQDASSTAEVLPFATNRERTSAPYLCTNE